MREINNVGSDVADKVEADETIWDAEFRDSKGRVVLAPASVAEVPIADTHCHLDMLKHPALAIAQAAAHKVTFLVTVVDPTEDAHYTYRELENWCTQADALLAKWESEGRGSAETVSGDGASDPDGESSAHATPRCRIIAGCHPHNAAKYDASIESLLYELAADKRTAAIGEIGLDYHYDVSPRPRQREVFKRQLQIAQELELPVALHIREAHPDALAILEQCGWPEAGVLVHCYTLGPDELQPFLDNGASVAFGGTLTFKNAESLRVAAAAAPLERIMTETDAPFMAPAPLRGTVCTPADTIFTAAKLAEVRGVEGEAAKDMLSAVYENALRFFK